jgi:hypothetical protein
MAVVANGLLGSLESHVCIAAERSTFDDPILAMEPYSEVQILLRVVSAATWRRARLVAGEILPREKASANQ